MRRDETGPGGSRRRILVTGSAGVVGSALADEFEDHHDLIWLVHRTRLERPCGTTIVGDVSRPLLGLAHDDFSALARHVDAVVHAAAVTNFTRPPAEIEAVNVEGTRHVAAFARAADVPLYHLSTAFVHPIAHAESGREPDAYQRSKQIGEQVVREAGIRHVILRPSMVVGDSQTGRIARFQGFHAVFGLYLQGYLPIVPTRGDARVDFVPQDVLARVVRAMVERGLSEGEYWIGAGDAAPSMAALAALTVSAARRLGVDVPPPRLVEPEMFERLIRPVFLPALPNRIRQTLERSLHFLRYMNVRRPLPSSLPTLLPALDLPPAPRAEDVYVNNIAYWAATTRATRRRDVERAAGAA